MSLLKKVASTAALVVLASSIVATGVANAYSPEELAAANNLAAQDIINDHSSNPAGYALDQYVLRQEIAAVARGIAGIAKKATCDNEFADVSATNPNTWACYTVEALRDAGKIAANPLFRPEDNITKAEALGMVVKAACDDQYAYDASKGTTWQEQVRDFAVAKGIVSTFSDFNALATRGFAFEAGNNAMTACKTVAENPNPDNGEGHEFEDLLCQLDPSSCQTTPENTSGSQTPNPSASGSETPNPSASGSETPATTIASVELASDTPAWATIPGWVTGVAVAKYTFTAGSEDLTINTLVLKRRGLSDKDTLTGLAAFTDEGRVSHSKDDSQENDTEATLTLLNGWVVVPAGTSKTITIVADVAASSVANWDEFAIELKSVQASEDVDGTPVLANTMKVGWVNADTLQVEDDSNPSDVKAGQSDVEIVKFKLKGDNDSDVIVQKITLKGEGTVDEEDELVNYKLLNDGNVIAETAKANGKYVTFDLGDGFVVKEDKTEKFSVTADIVGGAGKTISFKIDKNLDITAKGTNYGYGANVTGYIGTSFGTINIDAGELTLKEIDASNDKIRSNKDNVELGKIKVTNVAGKNLELQKLAIKVVSTGTWVENILENFEAVINGTSYELSRSTTGTNVDFADEDLTISLPQGITEITLRADTKENVPAWTKLTLSLATPTNTPADGEFYVVETEDDNVVTDLTPSSMTFKTLEVIDAAATVTKVPTPNLSVVRWAEDVVAGIFHVKADEASDISIDEVKVKVTATGAAATNQEIAKVALYKGSVSDANLLDQVSGSNLDSNGIATFNGFNVTIPADQAEDFVVTVSVVDGIDAVNNSPIKVKLAEVSAEDDDSDDVAVKDAAGNEVTTSNLLDSGANIAVTDSGKLTIEGDINNTDNQDPKTILAGNSQVVYSVDVIATNEEVEIDKITFNYTGTGLDDALVNATLYLDNVEVATNSHADITPTTITFDNLTNLNIPTQTAELRVELNTATVGNEHVGKTVLNAKITGVSVAAWDATGVDSGKDLAAADISTSSVTAADANTFSIVPVVVTPSVVSTFGTEAKIKVVADAGDNHQQTSNAAPSAVVKKLVFTDLGNDSGTGAYKIYKDGDSANITDCSINSNTVTCTLAGSGITVSDEETFVIQAKWTDAKTYSLKLHKDGVVYTTNSATDANNDGTVEFKSNLTDELDLGSKTF